MPVALPPSDLPVSVTSDLGSVAQGRSGRLVPGSVGNDCGPDVQDRTFLRGSFVVLVTASTITVLAGHP